MAKLEEAEDLNLTPIMNMVLVLIPLMLLNVVFMEISVIEVTMPQRSAGAAMNNGEPPKRLQLFISQQGFTIVEGMSSLPAKGECPASGPTICTIKETAEVETDRYNWLELYNTLFEIKDRPEWKAHDQIEIVADSSVNFGVLVKAMDIARYQLVPRAEQSTAGNGKMMKSWSELNEALPPLMEVKDADGNSAKMALGMFPVVVLGLPTVSN